MKKTKLPCRSASPPSVALPINAASSIETQGGEVTLRGRLGSWHEREVAQRAAWSVPGVTRVHDLTMIEV